MAKCGPTGLVDLIKLSANIPVVMVTGGMGSNTSVESSTEILSMNGTRLCSMHNPRKYHHSQTGLTICGGHKYKYISTRCNTFSGGEWKKSHTLERETRGHTAWASPKGVLLMGGVYRCSYMNRGCLPQGDTSTDLLTDDGGTTPSFKLSYGVM